MAVVDFARVPAQRIAMSSRRCCSPTPGGGGGFGQNTNAATQNVGGQARSEDRMSGTTIPVIGMTTYNFLGLGANKEAEVPIAQNIDVTGYAEGTLLVRVHDLDLDNSAKIDVIAYPVLPSPQDPSREFKAAAVGQVTLDTVATQNGKLVVDALSGPLGAFLTITVKADTDATPPTVLTATISVDLSLKSA